MTWLLGHGQPPRFCVPTLELTPQNALLLAPGLVPPEEERKGQLLA